MPLIPARKDFDKMSGYLYGLFLLISFGASIAGAIIYAWLLNCINGNIAMLIGACSVVLIRLLATRFCWDLPTATKK